VIKAEFYDYGKLINSTIKSKNKGGNKYV